MMTDLLYTEVQATIMAPKLKNAAALNREIEMIRVHAHDYLDVICTVCEKYNYEIEDVAKILNPIIQKKLEVECINKGLIDGVKVNSLEDLWT